MPSITTYHVLSLSLLLSCALSKAEYAETIAFDSVTFALEQDLQFSTLNTKANEIFDQIIFRCQQVAQQLNTKIIIVTNKDALLTEIVKTINFTQELKDQIAGIYDEKTLQYLLEIQHALIHHIHEATLQGFNGFKGITQETELSVKHNARILNKLELEKILTINEDHLATIDTLSRKLGQTKINALTQTTEYIIKKFNIDTIATRLLPYCILGHWWLLRAPQEMVDAGSTPLGTYKRNMTNLITSIIPASAVSGSEAKLQEAVKKISGGLIDIDGRSLATFGLGGLIMPGLKRDFKDLCEYATLCKRKAYAKLKGIPGPSETIKPPKGNFKKLIGFEYPKEQVKPAIAYLCDPDAFIRTGKKVHRGYLFIGPRFAGKRSLADAIAGEVTECLKANTRFLKANGNNTVCKVYEIHASALIKKPLAKVLEEARNTTPCIVVITNLEWLNMKDQELVASLIQSMTRYFKEKKEGIIIATTSDLTAINPALFENERLTGRVYIEYPNYDERKKFVEKKLLENGLSPDLFALDTMALATNAQSYRALNSLLEQLFTYANVTNQPITPKLFEEIIDREIYHIAQHQILPSEEINVLAAHYAGQTVAHMIQNPGTQLTKVTILPIIDGTSHTFGARFTYAQNHLDTTHYQNMRKECGILLAGDNAQELLLGSHACPLRTNKQQALALANKIILRSFDESMLSKKMREELRDEAVKLVSQISQEMQELLLTHKDALERIYTALKEKETLSSQDILSLL